MSSATALTATLAAALGTVRDPELDQPITDLGFVAGCTVTADGDAEIRLRLPTYFCAPNFAYLMVADAYDAVTVLPGVRTARVVLEDHFAAGPINDGVAAQAGFARAFDGEAAGELQDLRRDFLRKAVLAGTGQVCRTLRAAGVPEEALAGLTLGDIRPGPAESPGPAAAAQPGPALDRLRQRRAELGLPSTDDAPLLIDPETGDRVHPDQAAAHLRRARLTAISIEANGSICRGMLRRRYDTPGLQESGPDEEELT